MPGWVQRMLIFKSCGKRNLASLLGFVEVFILIIVVTQIVVKYALIPGILPGSPQELLWV
jgi:hypothetical protein